MSVAMAALMAHGCLFFISGAQAATAYLSDLKVS
jgi:hypothetical protein